MPFGGNDPFVTQLLRRWSELEANRKTTESTWDEINNNLIGRNRDFSSDTRTPGEQRVQRLYDDTSKVAGSLLAGAIHSLVSNPAARWFSLRYEQDEINQVRDASLWLHDVESRLYSAMARPQANFHSQLAEVWLDIVYFGTGGMFVEDRLGEGIRFSARPITELFLSEDATGRIDAVVRKFMFSARQAAQAFGVGNLPEKQKRDVEAGKMEEKGTYLHFILPNDEMAPNALDARGMPWLSAFVSLDDQRLVSVKGFHEMPIAVARWQKESSEIYGRGPGWNALSDQKMLNEMKRVALIAGQRAIDPPLLVDHEALLGGGTQLDVEPGGITPINTAVSSLNPPIQPIVSGSDFRISEALIQDTRQQVQDAFHHQLVQVIRDPNMTATQVIELSSQIQRHLAAIMSRMTTELLEPIIERVFAIEFRAGRLPPAPEELAGAPIQIDYVSPVARAQRASEAQSIVQLFTVGANLSQVDQGVLDVLDGDAAMRELAEAFGTPPTVIRSRRDVDARRQAAAEQAEEAAQMEQLAQGAAVAKDAAAAGKDAAAAGTIQ
jgi:hypothetical protein